MSRACSAASAHDPREELVLEGGDLGKGDAVHGEEEWDLVASGLLAGFPDGDREDDAMHGRTRDLEVVEELSPEALAFGVEAKGDGVDAPLAVLDDVEVDLRDHLQMHEILADFTIEGEPEQVDLTRHTLAFALGCLVIEAAIIAVDVVDVDRDRVLLEGLKEVVGEASDEALGERGEGVLVAGGLVVKGCVPGHKNAYVTIQK